MKPIYFFNSERLRNKTVYTHIVDNKGALPHSHTFVEFFYSLQGKGKHTINDESYIISQPGEYCLIMPKDVHMIELTGEQFVHRDILFRIDYFEKVCNFYSPSLFDDFMNNAYSLRATLSSENIKQLEKLVSYLSPSTETDLGNSLITTFIINLIIEDNLKHISYYPTWLNDFVNLLSQPQNFKLELSQLLNRVNYSKEHIRRTFKKYIGVTMTDYFNNQKMNHAYFLLQTTDLTTEQICEKINIDNVPYFYQLFKRTFGCTPHSIK